eukprot:763088-Hanusia_phi.AAC.9
MSKYRVLSSIRITDPLHKASIDVILSRASDRAMRTGRHVPQNEVFDSYTMAVKTAHRYVIMHITSGT